VLPPTGGYFIIGAIFKGIKYPKRERGKRNPIGKCQWKTQKKERLKREFDFKMETF